MNDPEARRPVSPRRGGFVAVLLAAALALAALVPAASAAEHTTLSASAGQTSVARHIVAIARKAMRADDLNAVILSVWSGDHDVVTTALGESLPGEPATVDMHFRIGAVAIAYLATALLELVDEHQVKLSDPVARWIPSLPHARRITLGMLVESRSGYADYERSPVLLRLLYANPFRFFRQQFLIRLGVSKKLAYRPGHGWNYAHTNFVILGHALEKITHEPLATVLRAKVLAPLGLDNTDSLSTPAIPPPVLEGYDSERGVYEDATYWNPSWSLATGAIMTSDIGDLVRSAIAVGRGTLLSRKSYREMIAPRSPIPGTPVFYGMGVILDNTWVLQNPLLPGYQAVMAYLPSKQIAVAITTTLGPKASSSTNYSTEILKEIGAYLAPDRPPL